MTPARDLRDTIPSASLALAGALARAGWDIQGISNTLGLPLAFTEMLHQTAVIEGEPAPGHDTLLIGALTRRLEDQRVRHSARPSRGQGQRRSAFTPAVIWTLIAWNFMVLLIAFVMSITQPSPSPLRLILLGTVLLSVATTHRCAGQGLLRHRKRPFSNS